MENEVLNQVIRTERKGSIAGRNVTISFENKPGEMPVTVTANCSIPSTDPMKSTNININVGVAGNKSINITGPLASDERFSIVSGMEAEIALIFTPTI